MKKLFGILVIVALWQFGSTLTSPLFVPSPLAVYNALVVPKESAERCFIWTITTEELLSNGIYMKIKDTLQMEQ